MKPERGLQQLRYLLESQTKQLQEQKQQMQEQKQQMREQKQQMQLLEEKLNSMNAGRENSLASSAADPGSASSTLRAVTATAALTPGSLEPNQDKNPDEPLSIHVKGITLTPGGFFAAETVWRQRALSADVNTPFNSLPLASSSMGHVTELNSSGRQSRISMLVEGKLSNVKLSGYYEADFLSAGTTSNNNQSSSYTFRQRQFWSQAAYTNGWTVTGGQMWSLITETTQGASPNTEAVPLVLDAAYNVGFSWAREYGLRVSKNLGSKFWVAASIEEAGTTNLGVHGNANNILVGAPGATGGAYNPIANYAFNKTPNFVFKAIYQNEWGHLEAFGLVSTFRDRYFPCATNAVTTLCGGVNGPSSFGAAEDTRLGGGVGVNARADVFHRKAELGLHFFGGEGIGRYGAASLSEVSARPNGQLALIHNFQTLATLELHPLPKLDVFMYAGGEYAGRLETASGVGYGLNTFNNFGCFVEAPPGTAVSTPTGVGGTNGFVPGNAVSCTGDTRNIIEGTLGFWYRVHSGPKGTLQVGSQYSYVVRNTWSGVGNGNVTFGSGCTPTTCVEIPVTSNGGPHSVDNMIFTSFRYYLP